LGSGNKIADAESPDNYCNTTGRLRPASVTKNAAMIHERLVHGDPISCAAAALLLQENPTLT
jgi:hypothetical protein